MQANTAQQNQQNNSTSFKPAEGWGRVMITSSVKGAKPVSLGKDFPMSVKNIVARSLINQEIENQKNNPGAPPLQYTVTLTIGLPNLNDDKDDIAFAPVKAKVAAIK